MCICLRRYQYVENNEVLNPDERFAKQLRNFYLETRISKKVILLISARANETISERSHVLLAFKLYYRTHTFLTVLMLNGLSFGDFRKIRGN